MKCDVTKFGKALLEIRLKK